MVHLRSFAALMAAASLAACSSGPRPAASNPAGPMGTSSGFGQAPPFSRLAYAPFSRADAVAIALREWRLWGNAVNDDPPGSRPPRGPDEKPERYPGLWQRVGEYWWESQDSGTVTAYWTGKHDGNGTVFPSAQDGHFPWSAAFISYIMRIAGAGDRFPYSAAHATYINAAKQRADGDSTGGWAVVAERPDRYAPLPGDLICLGRGGSHALTYEDLPTTSFPGHCDVVVAATPGQLSVIGGNVDDTVTEKHIPTTPSGMLSDPVTGVVDTRYPWFVVLRVLYDS